MTKSWIPIVIFLFAFSLLAFRSNQKKVQVIIIPVAAMNRTLDSIQAFVLPHIGNTLTVSEANQVKDNYGRFFNNLIRVSKLDSVEVK